jgi:hypothetical protein
MMIIFASFPSPLVGTVAKVYSDLEVGIGTESITLIKLEPSSSAQAALQSVRWHSSEDGHPVAADSWSACGDPRGQYLRGDAYQSRAEPSLAIALLKLRE